MMNHAIWDIFSRFFLRHGLAKPEEAEQVLMVVHDKLFSSAFESVVVHEGEYVFDPQDAGGETKFGISKRAYPNIDIKNLTLEEAKGIYFDDYWAPSNCDRFSEFPQDIVFGYFDCVINCGIVTAGRIFQSAVNVALRSKNRVGIVEDGIVGPITIKHAQNVIDLLPFTFKIERCRYYLGLADKRKGNRKFLRGWLHRVI